MFSIYVLLSVKFEWFFLCTTSDLLSLGDVFYIQSPIIGVWMMVDYKL